VEMQAALQPFVDGAISKTVPVPESRTEAEFRALFELAYRRCLKGFTVFREGAVLGDVLVPQPSPEASSAGAGAGAGAGVAGQAQPGLRKDECC
jgi:ribonucleoside-diphosphate reductase alpha chain